VSDLLLALRAKPILLVLQSPCRHVAYEVAWKALATIDRVKDFLTRKLTSVAFTELGQVHRALSATRIEQAAYPRERGGTARRRTRATMEGDAPANTTMAEAMALRAPSSCRAEKMPTNIGKYLEKGSSPLYDELGLFNQYRVRRPGLVPKALPAR
jgi:hypothetical protein